MSRAASLEWRPLDAAARGGQSFLVRQGTAMALARWNGSAWVYPATGNRSIDFEPDAYYDPSWRSAMTVTRG